MAEGLDPERFQPWVYCYPSGVRLETLSNALNNIVERLQGDYDFKCMGIVGHSMGGLVARSFILKHRVVNDKVR